MDHSEEKIRLRVSTNTGLNLMCSVVKEWKIDRLLNHIATLYSEVT